MAGAVPPVDRSGDGPPDRPSERAPALALAFAEILRESLALGPGRESIDAMLSAVAEIMGYEAMLVGRAEGDELILEGSVGFGHDPAVEIRAHLHQGIVGAAYRTGEPIRVADARDEPRWWDTSEGRHRSGLAVPMRLTDRVWGVLDVESRRVDAFDEDDVATLVPLADGIAWALEAMRLRVVATERAEREERLRRGLEATAAVVTAALGATDRGSVLDRMVRGIRDQLGWDALEVLLLEEGVLRVAVQYGFPAETASRPYPPDRGIVGRVAVTGQPHLARDTSADPYFDPVVATTRSELAVPLVFAGNVRGVVNAESPVTDAFSDDDLDTLGRIVEQMGLVLHNVELLAAQQETVSRLHELDRLKSRLLTIASHELRTPLTVVLGFAETLSEHAERLTADRIGQYAGLIARQAGSLARLVDQMLVAAQLEQGELDLQPGPTDLGPLVIEALGGPRDEIEVLPGVHECRVHADPFRLRQVLGNLFDNAVKYASEAGRIQVDARQEGDTVTILLRDEGPGIPAAERERVFERFHQFGEHGVAGRRGVGLGLALARDLIRLMGGDLVLASAEGYGATFLVRLPSA